MLEPARYESVATPGETPGHRPETDGFVLGVLHMEATAKRWISLPGSSIPPGIEVYIAANGKDLVALRSGSAQGPIRDAAGPPAEPPAGGTLASEEFEVANANFTVVYVATAGYLANLLEAGSLS